MEMHELTVTVEGEYIDGYRDEAGAYALFRRDDGTYVVHCMDTGGHRWLEDGRSNGLTVQQVRQNFAFAM